MTTTRTINWGILGTGRIAEVIAGALPNARTATLTAIASRTQANADGFGDKHDVPKRFGQYEDLLRDPDVDAVYISLPNHLHCEWAVRCAEAGKHILCEKPLATNQAEAMVMVEAARRHGVCLMEAFMYRCHPSTAKLAELVRDGTIGDVRFIEAKFSADVGADLSNIRLQNEAAGGSIMDLGCYCLSMARLLAGAAQKQPGPVEPVSLKAVGRVGAESRVDEWTTASVDFGQDVIASLTCANRQRIGTSVSVFGSNGRIEVDNPWFPGRDGSAATFTLHRADADEPETIETQADVPLYAIEADVLARMIADNQPQAPTPCMTWRDSIGNMAGLDQWRKEIDLTFDRELRHRITQPLSGKALHTPDPSPMPTGRIEGVEKAVSRIVMGTMIHICGTEAKTAAMLDHFAEQGGTCLDTAHLYKTEPRVGHWLKTRGVRERMVVIGKGGATTAVTPEMLDQQLHESLERLDTDYLDVYVMHRDNPDIPAGEFVDCLNRHREAGRLRAFGGSNWTTARIEEANNYAKKEGVPGFTASSPNFTLAKWNEPMWDACVTATDDASRQWYHQHPEVALLAWSSQASGLFAGRYKPSDRQRLGDEHLHVRTWFNDANFQRVDRARQLAEERGVTPAQIALAYVLNQPMNIYALIGPETIEQANESFAAADLALSDAERAWLNLESDQRPF